MRRRRALCWSFRRGTRKANVELEGEQCASHTANAKNVRVCIVEERPIAFRYNGFSAVTPRAKVEASRGRLRRQGRLSVEVSRSCQLLQENRHRLPLWQTSGSDPRSEVEPHLLRPKGPPLSHQGVLSCFPRAERWLDEATARHDTASTKFPAELRARYRNLSLLMCLGNFG